MVLKLIILFTCLLFTFCSCRKDKEIKDVDETGLRDTIVANFEIKGISYVATNAVIDSSNINSLTTVRCNWISQMPFAFCQLNSSQVTYDPINQWWGETDIGIITTTELARQNGIKTMIKPQLWINGSYTGAFVLNTENEWQAWETNYKNYILHFAHLADSLNVEMFCVGTELKLVVQNRPQLFISLIDSIRTFYPGKIIYAANWDDYTLVPFWNKLDYIGIDGYFPLSSAATPSVEEIVENWQSTIGAINSFRVAQNKDVIFTEIGYKSVDNTTFEPWNPNSAKVNVRAQANATQAFFESFSNKAWFKGAFLWKWYPNHLNAGGLNNSDYTPQNKPAQVIINKCF